MLQKALKKGGPVLRFSDLSAEHGEAMYRHACTVGLEGIISKKLSRYKSGACRSWLKVKTRLMSRAECRETPQSRSAQRQSDF